MIFRIIITFLLTFCCILFNNDTGYAKNIKKILIAVPDFIVGEEIPDSLASALSEILQTEFENSGRVITKNKSDIAIAIEDMDLSQVNEHSLIIDCSHDKACIKRLGRKMVVDYISYSRISKVLGQYIIEIQLIPISDKSEIPIMVKKVKNSEDLIDAVKTIGINISHRFPLEGSILILLQNNKNAIINLGSTNNLKIGDELIVLQESIVEGFRDRRRVGSLVVTKIQTSRSKAQIKSGRGDIRKGDIILLNQEELLKELEEQRISDEAEVNALKGQRDKAIEYEEDEVEEEEEEKEEGYTDEFSRKASLIRVGFSGYKLLNLGEPQLNQYYVNGLGVMADYFFFRIRGKSHGNGFDFLLRYCYRQFKMTEDTFKEFQINYPAADSGNESGKSKLYIHSTDIGGRLLFGGYLLFGRFDFYILGASRMAYLIESSDNGITNYFKAMGIIGGAGIEISFYKYISIFTEYNYGFTTFGDKRYNIDGHQMYVGVSLRTSHF